MAEEQKQQKSAAGGLAGQAAGKGVKSLGKNLASNASKAVANAAKAAKMGAQAVKVAATAASAAATAGLALAAAAIQAAVEKLVGKMKKEHIAMILALPLAILGAIAAIPLLVLILLLIAIVILIVVVPLILLIINSGAFVVPPYEGGILQRPGNVESPYIRVIKTANPNAFPNPATGSSQDVVYTITITAKQGTLTNITFDNKCSVIWATDRGAPPPCPSLTLPTPPTSIPAGTTYTLNYTLNYPNPPFSDANVLDVFSVTANAPLGTGTTRSTASGSANVRIGNPPEECPGPWPIASDLRISQGPGPQHYPIESVDVSASVGKSVYATHGGQAEVIQIGIGYGYHVKIWSICGGVRFRSVYAHLSVVDSSINGQVVNFGRELGLSGGQPGTPGSGSSTGPHLHYDFDTLFMWVPYIYMPRGITSESQFRGCVDSGGIGLCGYVP